MLEAGQLLCTAGKWLSQDSVVLLQDFCFPLIVKVPGRGHALPASQHLRAEEEQGPGAAGSLVSGLQAFSSQEMESLQVSLKMSIVISEMIGVRIT